MGNKKNIDIEKKCNSVTRAIALLEDGLDIMDVQLGEEDIERRLDRAERNMDTLSFLGWLDDSLNKGYAAMEQARDELKAVG